MPHSKLWGPFCTPASRPKLRHRPLHCHLLPILRNAAFPHPAQSSSMDTKGGSLSASTQTPPGHLYGRNSNRETPLPWRSDQCWAVSVLRAPGFAIKQTKLLSCCSATYQLCVYEKWLHFSEPQFLHLKKAFNNTNFHRKDWCWSANTLATWCEEPTHWKRAWCW